MSKMKKLPAGYRGVSADIFKITAGRPPSFLLMAVEGGDGNQGVGFCPVSRLPKEKGDQRRLPQAKKSPRGFSEEAKALGAKTCRRGGLDFAFGFPPYSRSSFAVAAVACLAN